MLIPESGGLKVLLVVLGVDFFEDIFETAIVSTAYLGLSCGSVPVGEYGLLLHNSVLRAHVL